MMMMMTCQNLQLDEINCLILLLNSWLTMLLGRLSYVFIVGSNAGQTMFRGTVEEYWLPTPFTCFPFTSPPMRHHVPSDFNQTLAGAWGNTWATLHRVL